MRRLATPAVVLLTVAALAAGCGDDEDGGGGPKPPKLTSTEFELVNRFIAGEVASLQQAQQLCRDLEAGPDTAILEVVTRTCEDGLSVGEERQKAGRELAAKCAATPTDSCIAALRDFRDTIKDFEEVLDEFNDGVRDAIAPGPCREALLEKDVEQYDEYFKAYDAALDLLDKGQTPQGGLGNPPAASDDIGACRPGGQPAPTAPSTTTTPPGSSTQR